MVFGFGNILKNALQIFLVIFEKYRLLLFVFQSLSCHKSDILSLIMETLFLDLEIFSKNTLQIFLVIFEKYRLLFVRVFTLISDILSLTMETLFLDLGIFSKNTLLIFFGYF
jgi:hypothetical protein